MTETPEIRPAVETDWQQIDLINLEAFAGPVEGDLVRNLRTDDAILVELVAVEQDAVVGHIVFSRAEVESDTADALPAALLGPVSVSPLRQRAGIGGQLIQEGHRLCQAIGVQLVVLVGHTDYYPRFGYSAELARGIESPWSGKQAFMATDLTGGDLAGIEGKLVYPRSFEGL